MYEISSYHVHISTPRKPQVEFVTSVHLIFIIVKNSQATMIFKQASVWSQKQKAPPQTTMGWSDWPNRVSHLHLSRNFDYNQLLYFQMLMHIKVDWKVIEKNYL